MPLRTGKKPRQVDPRTIRYSAVRAPGPWRAPAAYDYDGEHPGKIPLRMFLNDTFGDCVEAESGHFKLRAEYDETGAVPSIADAEIQAAYFAETGGADDGLVMLDHLKLWRAHGLPLGGGAPHFIYSFVEIVAQNHEQVMEAVVETLGVNVGIALPLSAMDQTGSGQPWDVVAGPRGAAGSAGGHCVLCVGYDKDGLNVVTWGQHQRVTWRFWDAFVDECYAVVDARDETTALAAALDIATS